MFREAFRLKAARTFPAEGALELGGDIMSPKLATLLDRADELYEGALAQAPPGHVELVLLLAHTELDRAEAERLAAHLKLDISGPEPPRPVVVRRGGRYYTLWLEAFCG